MSTPPLIEIDTRCDPAADMISLGTMHLIVLASTYVATDLLPSSKMQARDEDGSNESPDTRSTVPLSSSSDTT
jgi:hypothetical protein